MRSAALPHSLCSSDYAPVEHDGTRELSRVYSSKNSSDAAQCSQHKHCAALVSARQTWRVVQHQRGCLFVKTRMAS